ncbi:MAG: stage II sporulation protein M [Ruminococcus sp.]|nr:stage II sporulation protein M [Ruminococcus sp.]
MKHGKYTDFAKKRNRGFFLMTLAVIAGTAIGSFNYGAGDIPFLHQYFSPVYSGNTLTDVFGNTFMSLALFSAGAFIMGMFALGQPFGVLLLMYRGYGIGISASMMYYTMGFGAVPAVMILLLPKAVCTVIVSMLAVRELMRSSCMIFRYITGRGGDEPERRFFRLYCIKFAVIILISALISAADALMNYLFAKLV